MCEERMRRPRGCASLDHHFVCPYCTCSETLLVAETNRAPFRFHQHAHLDHRVVYRRCIECEVRHLAQAPTALVPHTGMHTAKLLLEQSRLSKRMPVAALLTHIGSFLDIACSQRRPVRVPAIVN